MWKKLLLLAVIGMIAAILPGSPASAQATRTWVSGVGDDANPCSRTAPCKTFAGSISKTAPGGEIDCLDPGGFGAVTITKAITILCESTSNGGVLVAGTNGIVVAAGANDVVVLQGLDFEGLGSGLNGVSFLSGLRLYVRNCSIRDFTQAGVSVSGTVGSRTFIINTFIENDTVGINVQGTNNGIATSNAFIDGNSTIGIQVNGNNNSAALINTIVTGNPTALNLVNGGSANYIGPSNVIGGGVNGPISSSSFK